MTTYMGRQKVSESIEEAQTVRIPLRLRPEWIVAGRFATWVALAAVAMLIIALGIGIATR